MQANPPVQAVAAPPDAPGLGEYFGILRKRRKLLFIVAGPIIALGAGFALFMPPVYRSQGLLEIDESNAPKGTQQTPDMKSLVERESDETQYADAYVQGLGTIVLSDKNLTKLLKEHKLYDDQDADLGAAIQQARSNTRVDIVTTPILDPESGRERNVVTAFTVSYDNADPQRAKEGARWLVDAYLKQNRLDREATAMGAAKFFGGEAERVRTHVAELEAKLAVFKAKNFGKLPDTFQQNQN